MTYTEEVAFYYCLILLRFYILKKKMNTRKIFYYYMMTLTAVWFPGYLKNKKNVSSNLLHTRWMYKELGSILFQKQKMTNRCEIRLIYKAKGNQNKNSSFKSEMSHESWEGRQKWSIYRCAYWKKNCKMEWKKEKIYIFYFVFSCYYCMFKWKLIKINSKSEKYQ